VSAHRGALREIRRVAIANRGEAAMRCIRGIKSLRAQENSSLLAIALYTDSERDAPFVRHADVAHPLASSAPGLNPYLDHEILIDALRATEADAVWPGWGFVAEDPDFADRVRAEGLCFIGPSGATLRTLGEKIRAKRVAEALDIPVAAWHTCSSSELDEALRESERIGYPLLVKASGGGGGRGIRRVERPEDLAEAMRATSSAARATSGGAELFLERLVSGGRHIEVQIAGDSHGVVRSLGCRDCSAQRRYQKVVEEGPPPGLSAQTREALERAAIRIAEHVGYVGLGTVEFLVQEDGFYFLEVNPRLQVEHGITEELTGLDLVQLQIRIARGEGLAGLRFRERGAAIEARLCAEDAQAGFVPAPGRVVRFDPVLGPGIRIDTGVATGSEIPAAFDSLIAKVIARAETREDARSRLVSALTDLDLVVRGGTSNKGYLLDILEAEDFRRGTIDTGWLERRRPAGSGAHPHAGAALVAAAILCYRDERRLACAAFAKSPARFFAGGAPSAAGREIDLSQRGESYRLRVLGVAPGRYRVKLAGDEALVGWHADGAHKARLRMGSRELRVLHDLGEVAARVEIEGQAHAFGRRGIGEVRADTSAVVIAVPISVGQQVEAGQRVFVLEAMKTEMEVVAPVAGRVAELRVRKGQQVSQGEILLILEPERSAAGEGAVQARVQLPPCFDPLERWLAGDDAVAPDVRDAAGARVESDARMIRAAREEIRHVLAGYDACPDRAQRIAARIAGLADSGCSDEVLSELAEARGELKLFAHVEEIFDRTPRLSRSGRLEASRYERVRTQLARVETDSEALDPDLRERLREVLCHHGITESSAPAERRDALLRVLGSRADPGPRSCLALALIGALAALSRLRRDLVADAELEATLSRVSALRAQVSNAVADAADAARYVAFDRGSVAERAERITKRLDAWLAASALEPQLPPAAAFRDLVAAPRVIFDRVGRWLDDPDPRRQAIAQAAHLRRLYATLDVEFHSWIPREEVWIERLDLVDGRTVIGAAARTEDLVRTAESLCDEIASLRSEEGCAGVDAVELLLHPRGEGDPAGLATWLHAVLRRRFPDGGCFARRITLTMLQEGRADRHYSFVPSQERIEGPQELHGLHPETAARVGLDRLAGFELERVDLPTEACCFLTRSREGGGGERIVALGEVWGSCETGEDGTPHALGALEGALLDAASAVRGARAAHDPQHRLHCNRIGLSVAPGLPLEREGVEGLLRRLLPALRHLGLERVVLRCRLRAPGVAAERSVPVECHLSESSGGRAEISWRPRSDAPLSPSTPYERAVAEARRRGLVHPYEIVRMLAGDGPRAAAGPDDLRSLPPGVFEEYDLEPGAPPGRALSVAGRPHGTNTSAVVFGTLSTPTAKQPGGMKRVLLLSDPTLGMGSLAAPECDRIVAAIDLAEELSLPVEWVPVSSGARIAMDSGTENLDATARVARRIIEFTQQGGVIHVIVHGVNVGAQSYFDALATMLMHTRGVVIMTPGGSMVLTGRAALEASGSVAAEDETGIGGFERIMGPNGEADYYARDLVDAYRILYEHYRYTYVAPGERHPRRNPSTDPVERDVSQSAYPADEAHGFRTVGEIFAAATNAERKRPFAMRAVMEAFIDRDGGHLERWSSMVGAETAIVWDAHLGGIPICLIGIESQPVPRVGDPPPDGSPSWMGGTLFPASSKKLARALNAANGNRPVVLLANLSGFDGSPESMRQLQLEYGAEIARAVVNFRGPIEFLVVSRYHGGAYVVFSQALNPNLRASALEGSYASVIGGAPAAAVVFRAEVRKRALRDPRVVELRSALERDPSPEARACLEEAFEAALLECQAQLAARFDAIHDVDRARRVGSLEAIVSLREARAHLIRQLELRREVS
jgi:acetyl/propionyl-CoA carboxylase alpha subunit/acetyl-CoA carboxylase carboxyltransferase component